MLNIKVGCRKKERREEEKKDLKEKRKEVKKEKPKVDLEGGPTQPSLFFNIETQLYTFYLTPITITELRPNQTVHIKVCIVVGIVFNKPV